jgi:hypothetical protein
LNRYKRGHLPVQDSQEGLVSVQDKLVSIQVFIHPVSVQYYVPLQNTIGNPRLILHRFMALRTSSWIINQFIAQLAPVQIKNLFFMRKFV